MSERTVDIEQVNFHHLRYFWAVANDGNLTRTAARLRVAQSALSSQIRQLEAQLGVELFEREGRRLVLTEAGRLALAFADSIFEAGTELLSTLERGRTQAQVLRIGAVATLSRNFQESFLKPVLERADVRLSVVSGVAADLLGRLEAHTLDVVLTNRPPERGAQRRLRCRLIARQPVSIVGPKRKKPLRLPRDLHELPMILPGVESAVRTEFDALCEQRGIEVCRVAEVDDMAMMRLLARDTQSFALLPSVVVRDELRDGSLAEHGVIAGLFETFYAVTATRKFEHPLVAALVARDEDDLLAMDDGRVLPKRRR